MMSSQGLHTVVAQAASHGAISSPDASADTPQRAASANVEQRDDQALFAAAQRGDYGAFESIVRRYHGRVCRLVQSLLKSPSDAEEVVQETFLNTFRKLHTFAYDSAPKTWLLRIAVNATLMRLRSQRRKPFLSLEDHRSGGEAREDEPFWAPNPWARVPEDAALSRELYREVVHGCERLPEKYRLVLLLRDVEGHSNEDVSQTLGITVPTVKARLHRARLFVRGHLDDYFRRR